jgi:hypothetical protein
MIVVHRIDGVTAQRCKDGRSHAVKAALIGLGAMVAAVGITAGVYVVMPGDDPEEVVQDVVTPTVTGSPAASPAEPPVASEPAAATPTPGSAPDGCIPGNEKIFQDEAIGLSFCYPAELDARIESTGAGKVVLIQSGSPGSSPFDFVLGWLESPMPSGIPAWPCPPPSGGLTILEQTIDDGFSLGGLRGFACIQRVKDLLSNKTYSLTSFAAARSEGLYFEGSVSYLIGSDDAATDSQRALATRILQSLELDR